MSFRLCFQDVLKSKMKVGSMHMYTDIRDSKTCLRVRVPVRHVCLQCPMHQELAQLIQQAVHYIWQYALFQVGTTPHIHQVVHYI